MTNLDDLFRAGVAQQVQAADEPDVSAISHRVIAGARRKRHVRNGINAALTVVASVAIASAAWGTIHTGPPPANQPTPSASPTLAHALPAPILEPVWDGSLEQAVEPAPGAFADRFDVAALTAIEPPSRNYPQAFEIADWVWDEVQPGWSLQTWDGDGADDPNNLYLVSPAGTYFLVRELDYFEGDEHWNVESWSAEPARAVLAGQDAEAWIASRRLVDLRSGETLRAWGATDGGGTSADYTTSATGFSGGRSVQVEFTMDRGYEEDGGELSPEGQVTVRVVSPNGDSRVIRTDAWRGMVPRVSGLGGDGHTALLQDGNSDVMVVDLDSARARAVALEFPEGQTCQSIALGPNGKIAAYCYNVDSLSTYVTTFAARTGAVLAHEEVTGSLFAVQGFDNGEGALVDAQTGAVIEIPIFDSSDTNVELFPIDDRLFGVTDTKPQHEGLLLYDRTSGESFTVLGATVRGSRALAAVTSVVPLTVVVPGESGLIMGSSP